MKRLKLFNIFTLFNLSFGQECHSDTDTCSEIVCPKITEMTTCIDQSLNGYSTYQLSVLINDDNIKNIYAIYGDDENGLHELTIPPAYQSGIINNNLGGIAENIQSIIPRTKIDSWMTIGITNGDKYNQLGSVGIDFNNWDQNNGIMTTNGAVYVTDPQEILSNTNEYIISQLTLNNNDDHLMIVNLQGHYINEELGLGRIWDFKSLRFKIFSKNNDDCSLWFDGCNICEKNNGIISQCTDLTCQEQRESYCISSDVSGH